MVWKFIIKMRIHFREQYGTRGEEILYVTPAGKRSPIGTSIIFILTIFIHFFQNKNQLFVYLWKVITNPRYMRNFFYFVCSNKYSCLKVIPTVWVMIMLPIKYGIQFRHFAALFVVCVNMIRNCYSKTVFINTSWYFNLISVWKIL